MARSIALLCLGFAACVPSRAALFDPVAQAVYQRTGLRPEWRASRSAAVEQRIQALLARPLGADDVALLAVLNSAELQARYAELGIAGGQVGSARALHNPELDAEIVFPLDGGDARLELSAVQDVSQLLTILPRARQADAELRAVRRQAVAATVELTVRARIAFYDVAVADRELALRRDIAEGATASATFARSLHQAGNLRTLDLIQQELFETEAEVGVGEAEAVLATRRERLNALLGLLGPQTTWTLSGDALAEPQAIEPGELEREAVAASLELEAERWRIEAAGQAIGVARLESFVPSLGLGVSVKQEEGGTAVGPLVSLAVPLWDWGEGKRSAAWARLRREQHRYAAIALEVRAAARASQATLVAATARARAMRERVLPLRQRLATESVLAYNAMDLDAFELIALRREQLGAEVRYLGALRDYWVARARVDQLRAGSLPAEWGTERREDSPASGAAHGEEGP